MAKTSLCVCDRWHHHRATKEPLSQVQPAAKLLPWLFFGHETASQDPGARNRRRPRTMGLFPGNPKLAIYIYIYTHTYIYIRTYIYLVYKWYIFANWMVIFITYHLLQELETTIDFRTGRNLETMIRTWVLSLKCFQIWWFNGWKYAIMWISILCTRCMYRSEGNIHPGLVCFSKDTK